MHTLGAHGHPRTPTDTHGRPPPRPHTPEDAGPGPAHLPPHRRFFSTCIPTRTPRPGSGECSPCVGKCAPSALTKPSAIHLITLRPPARPLRSPQTPPRPGEAVPGPATSANSRTPAHDAAVVARGMRKAAQGRPTWPFMIRRTGQPGRGGRKLERRGQHGRPSPQPWLEPALRRGPGARPRGNYKASWRCLVWYSPCRDSPPRCYLRQSTKRAKNATEVLMRRRDEGVPLPVRQFLSRSLVSAAAAALPFVFAELPR